MTCEILRIERAGNGLYVQRAREEGHTHPWQPLSPAAQSHAVSKEPHVSQHMHAILQPSLIISFRPPLFYTSLSLVN